MRSTLGSALVIACITACGAMLVADHAIAQGTPRTRVAIADLGVSKGREAATGALRTAIAHELATSVSVTDVNRARWIVHGAITRLESSRRGADTEAHCEVSLIVADARGGAMRATLVGRAHARGRSSARVLERQAMQGAVRGALRSITNVLGSLRSR